MKLPRASGVLLHPTSLPGPHGSGDFGPAAYHFVDWLVGAGQTLWQILPLGGIGAGNSPYMSSSAFAGNVLLIDLADLVDHGWLATEDLQPPAGVAAQRLHYGVVVPWRMAKLQAAAQAFARSARDADRADYLRFCEEQADWLDDYALFMSLADHHSGAVWSDWSLELAARKPSALRAAREAHAERIAFWTFCQWRFFRQWQRLRRYANDRGVKIIGDAPIFIAYHSAEVWANPQLFELDPGGRPQVVAGVPPDYFSATGQRWGNPLYRWKAHAADDYAWWTLRLKRIFEMVDIVRIDHFRGFAAYWEIPAEEPTAVRGRWRPGPGEALFRAVTRALGEVPIIAEDLGIITPDVDALRHAFDFPGMAILHFAFGGDSRNRYLPHNLQRDSVVYTGTHDNDTTQGWWSSVGGDERHAVQSYLHTDGADIAWDLIRTACASVADTAIYPMQDILQLGADARMNLPGQGEGWWAWRFDWSQVQPWHAKRLARLCQLYGRPALAPEPPPRYEDGPGL